MQTYTTGQLLDKLAIDRMAEMVTPMTDIIVKQTSDGLIVIKDGLSTKHVGLPLPLSSIVINAYWKIIKVEITFQQAVEYLRSGTSVYSVYDGETSEGYSGLDDMIYIGEAIDGKWFLED